MPGLPAAHRAAHSIAAAPGRDRIPHQAHSRRGSPGRDASFPAAPDASCWASRDASFPAAGDASRPPCTARRAACLVHGSALPVTLRLLAGRRTRRWLSAAARAGPGSGRSGGRVRRGPGRGLVRRVRRGPAGRRGPRSALRDPGIQRRAQFVAFAFGVGADLAELPGGFVPGLAGVGAGLVRAGLGGGGALGWRPARGLVPGRLVTGGVPVRLGGADLPGPPRRGPG